jgi:predicted phosphoribosyltransferase
VLVSREQAYREGRPMPDLAGRTVILVDDGIATGSSIRAAIRALRQLQPRKLVAAVPVGPRSGCRNLATIADEAVCATSLPRFVAVGCSYQDFGQTPDEEVEELLRAAASREGFAGPGRR